MRSDELKRRISAGRGDALADLVLKNARIINVFTDEIDTADIAISGNSIVGVGAYHGRKEVDLHGKYVCPGLIDGHIHIESSMLCGPAFEQAVLPHGTTAVVTDPHEISNVAGLEGLDFMLETTKNLTLSVYFMLPSCVPATDLDESGAVLNAEQLRPYYGDPRVLGLAELMNAYGTVRCDPKILQKIRDCTEEGKIVDSHNLIVAGDNDADMMLAGNTVRKNKGGLAFVADGQVVAELALPVAGLMSTESAESVAAKMQALNDALKAHGVAEDIGIFMTLAFVSLPVIPKLRLNTYGIIDVAQQKVVPAVF